jgi:hypothetical protein
MEQTLPFAEEFNRKQGQIIRNGDFIFPHTKKTGMRDEG